MKRIEQLLSDYGVSHQHPINKLLHWICVPLIVGTLLGLLWSLPVPSLFEQSPLPLNWAVIVVAMSMIYYLQISPLLSAGILPVLLGMLALLHAIDTAGGSVWLLSVLVFVIAWIGQFVGHHIEGKRPSFFQDVQFLLIGPLWLLAFIYRRLGVRY